MSNAAILRAMERIVTLTSDAAPRLEVGRVYSIPAGEGVTRTAYYICDTADAKSAIFGLQSPVEILVWLNKGIHNCIGNTPRNLMAERSALKVTATENFENVSVAVFQDMKTLLCARNATNLQEVKESIARNHAHHA